MTWRDYEVRLYPFGPNPHNPSCKRCPNFKTRPPIPCHGCVYVKLEVPD